MNREWIQFITYCDQLQKNVMAQVIREKIKIEENTC